MITYTFLVEGMRCSSCALLIDDAVEELDGIQAATTSVRTGRTTVQVASPRGTPERVIAAIAELGYPARLEPEGKRANQT